MLTKESIPSLADIFVFDFSGYRVHDHVPAFRRPGGAHPRQKNGGEDDQRAAIHQQRFLILKGAALKRILTRLANENIYRREKSRQ